MTLDCPITESIRDSISSNLNYFKTVHPRKGIPSSHGLNSKYPVYLDDYLVEVPDDPCFL